MLIAFQANIGSPSAAATGAVATHFNLEAELELAVLKCAILGSSLRLTFGHRPKSLARRDAFFCNHQVRRALPSRHEAVDSKPILNYVVGKLLGLVTLTSDRKTVSGTATDVNGKATQGAGDGLRYCARADPVGRPHVGTGLI